MRVFVVSALLIIAFHPALAQDQPAPKYLVTHDFPDTVASVALVTPDGKPTTFGYMIKSYKGKKVMMDIWASWCRDCITGLPELEKLKAKTSGDKVVYVFLSVDENDAKWRTAIDRFGIRGEHYRVTSGWKGPLSNYIVLDWVPRYITLNEEGRVVMPKAIFANDRLLEKSLLK
jgi:thiol-disulfide isomerase/thioredoxin